MRFFTCALRRLVKRPGHDSVFLDRLTATLATGFAVLATLLAALGLYSVLAYGVKNGDGLILSLAARPARDRRRGARRYGPGLRAVFPAV